MKMNKNLQKITVVAVLLSLFGVSSAFAENVYMDNYYKKHNNRLWSGKRGFTPRQRVEMNALKAKKSPFLRDGRWDWLAIQPATSANYQNTDLAQEILMSFRKDEELIDIPAELKVQEYNGMVTLEGLVSTQAEKQLIEEKVSQMQGVRGIKSYLQVR